MSGAGCEYVVDASGCAAPRLTSLDALQALVDRIVRDLRLKPVGEPQWHVFPEPGGITGLVLLSESHLALHTFPETGFATFNLYHCRAQPAWPWERALAETLGASDVRVRTVERGAIIPSRRV
jgi:S-adenosylmethionine decarboxylase